MKKIVLVILSAVLIYLPHDAAPTNQSDPSPGEKSGRLAFTFLAGARHVSQNVFADVYGPLNVCLGLDVALRFTPRIEWFLHTDILSVKGKTSFIHDSTSLTILPLEMGLRVHWGGGHFLPYLGAGGGIYFFSEESTFNHQTYTSKKNPFGYFGETGLKIVIIKKWYLDLKIKFTSFTIHPDEPQSSEDQAVYTEKRDLRGFTVALGFGVSI